MEKPTRRHPSLLVTCFALAGTVTAQSTLTVGPGGYAQISDAIAAASPGDSILVQSGSYLPFDLAIGVTIFAPSGATVTTPPGGPGIPWIHTVQPPPGQQATIVGLTYVTNPVYPPAEPPLTVQAMGNVVFADCVFNNYSDYPSHAVICDGDVQFDRCQFTGVHDCLSVIGGRVIANQCRFTPFEVMWAPRNPSCLVATDGIIGMHFCEMRGAAAQHSLTGAPAVRLSGIASLSLADCTVLGGASNAWASTAVVSTSANPVLHSRSNIAGGQGQLSWYPPLSGPGPAFNGASLTASLIGGGSAARPTVGAPFYGSVIGPANSVYVVVLSFTRTSATPFALTTQPVHFDPSSAVIFSSGLASFALPWPGFGFYTWQTVTLPTAMYGSQFWLHSIVWDGAAFQVGPTFGGLVY